MNKDLLELYSDYLFSAFSYTTATGLSAMTNGAISHDKITRFVAEKELDSPTLWRLVKPLVRELEGDEEGGVLIVEIPSRRSPTPTKASSSAGTMIIVRGEPSKA